MNETWAEEQKILQNRLAEADTQLTEARHRIMELEIAQPKPLEITDEMVEMAAKSEWAKHYSRYTYIIPWEKLLPQIAELWRSHARAALEAVKDHLVGACPGCAAKVERIEELGIDALAMETEMSQAATRIKALEAVLRENRKWCEQGRYWGPMAIIDKHLKDHSITLPDPEESAPATREPYPGEIDAHMEEEHARSQEPAGDEELRKVIDDCLGRWLERESDHEILTSKILSLIGPCMTPEIQTRLAQGDAAIATLRKYRTYRLSLNVPHATDVLDTCLDNHGILDLVTKKTEKIEAPKPMDQIPLPDYLDPSTKDWIQVVCTINAIIDHLADQERADAPTVSNNEESTDD